MTDAQRQCGDCSLCCKVLGIPELNKPKDEWCPNFAAGIGSVVTTTPGTGTAMISSWIFRCA